MNDSFGYEAPIAFNHIIEQLKDEDKPFPARDLYRFSGLESQDLEAFKIAWHSLSLRRKTALLEDLELIAEGDTVLNFEPIASIAMDEEDDALRQLALRNLWQTEDLTYLSRLTTMLREDSSEKVRAQAAQVLGRYVLLGELGRIKESDHKEAEAALFEAMQSEKIDEVRQRALESLAYSSDGRVAGLIEDAYDFGEDDWKAAALFAMGRTADARWSPNILERLDDPMTEISREAARAAGELQLEEAIPTLLNLVHDEEREVRMAAGWSLSQIGGEIGAEVTCPQ